MEGTIMAAGLFLGLAMGIGLGILIGEIVHSSKVKKAFRSRCRSCAHFAECQGVLYRHNDKKNNCKMFKKATPTKEVNAITALCKAVQSLGEDVDSLYGIASDNDNAIQDLAKQVFDKDEKKKAKKAAKHR